MLRRQFLLNAPFLAAATVGAAPRLAMASAEELVIVVGHQTLPRIDGAMVARLYTGRAVEAGGMAVSVVNLPAGHATRDRFLKSFLQMDEERYRAYWTVRRHVGRGTPPPELQTPQEVIDFVQRTPGALGYLDAAQARSGLNVIARA